jgi:hypothetical protein
VLNLISENKFMHRTAYMYTINKSSPPTFSKAGKVTMKVSNITFRLFCYLNILKILMTLKDLTIFVEETPFTCKVSSKIIPASETHDTMKSKTFQGSKKYLLPKPANFIRASKINMEVKI